MPIITTGSNSINISARVGVVVKEGMRSRSSASDVLPLQFTTQPQSQSVVSGNQVTFTCVVAGGYSPYSYQWKKDGVNIAGATSSSYTFTSVTGDNGKSYSVAVTDFSGNTIISDSAILSVSIPLSFTSQPQSKTVDEYSLATFSTSVTGGTAPYSYQWKKNNTNVGTNSASLSFTAAAADKNASITVVVTDSAGAVIASTAAVLGVTSYRFKLNGTNQYVKLSPVASAEPSGVTLEFDAIANVGATGTLAGGNQNGLLTWRMGWAGGVLDLYRTATVTIDGVVRTNGQSFALDGQSHHIKITLASGGYRSGITCVGAVHNSDTGETTNYSNSTIYNINPYNAAVNGFVPLNNKTQGANQLATSGTINATIVNYSAANWVAI